MDIFAEYIFKIMAIYGAIGYGVAMNCLLTLQDKEYHAVVMARLRSEPCPEITDLRWRVIFDHDPTTLFAILALIVIWPWWMTRQP